MKNKIIVGKMIKYIEKIIAYTEGVSYDDFSKNSILVEDCIFNLGQLGELSNKTDKDFEAENSGIPWRTMYGLRNKIVHDYEGVNLVLIWDIIKNDLPELKNALSDLYKRI